MLRYQSERELKWFGPAMIRWSLVLRGFLTCSFVTLWWAALPTAPLGDCIAVIYCSPLLTVLLSRVVLGEKILLVFPIQALSATIGMAFIVQPPSLLRAFNLAPAGDSTGGDYTLVFAAMVIGAIIPVVTRQTKDASWIEVMHVTNFLAAFVMMPFMFCLEQYVGGALATLPSVGVFEAGLVVLAAIGSFMGVAMQTRGYQLAEPGKAGMYNYLEIPFAYLLQLIGTPTPISAGSIIGAILILMGCLLGAVAQWLSSFQKVASVSAEPLLKDELEGSIA